MHIECTTCGSTNLIKKGKEYKAKYGCLVQRYKCKSCGNPVYVKDSLTIDEMEEVREITTNKTWVVTTAVNGVEINMKFLDTLISYCKINNAELYIVPVKYDQGLEEGYSWDSCLHKYFIQENVFLTNGLKLLAGLHVSPAIGNPLSGFEPFSKGNSVILPHPQLMMKTIAMSHVDPACMLTTTGSITNNVYTSTKQGEKAAFNHSFSALVVEEDSDIDSFHIRVLNSDETGSFYDVDMFYDGEEAEYNTNIPALIMGDEHIIHVDPKVTKATFTNADSIVSTLRPKIIGRHDSLDFYSSNHHHQKQVFTQYAKYISGKNKSEDELKLTIEYIINTTPEYATSVIISSNHNDHLCRWLQECNPKNEPWNALLYHELMYLMLKNTTMGKAGAEYPNPFELWCRHNYELNNIKFIGGQESFKIHDIELSFHGHQGTNGSRGGAEQFSKLGTKSIIGHSHVPSIHLGCYVVGHSCYSKLEYNQGPSSWDKAHCLIQPNGKRQLVFIKKGKWRR